MTRATTLVLFALWACGCGSASENVPVAEAFGAPLATLAPPEHAWFPLEPGMTWTYEGDASGRWLVERVQVLRTPRSIQSVSCTGLAKETWLDGELVETSTEWFHVAASGDLFKYGEEATEVVDGVGVPTEDSWIAGEGDAWPWVFLPAEPARGQVLEGYGPDGRETVRVLELFETAVTAAGTFGPCLAVEENVEDVEDEDIVLYAAGVGRVAERGTTGTLELTGHRPGR